MLVFGGLFVLFVSSFLVSLSLLGQSQEDDAAAEDSYVRSYAEGNAGRRDELNHDR